MPSLLSRFVAWAKSPTGVAVNALGITQIVSWGTTLYALAVLGAPIANDTGWSPSIVFGGISIGLLVSGAISTHTGRLIDSSGARALMSIGSVLNAVGLVALAASTSEWAYLASWAFLGISMRLTLYDAAFAALVQVTPSNGRRAISFLTLWGGFASTVFWPIGHVLNDMVGWRETCLIFAVLNVLVCLPLHWWGLARREDEADTVAAGREPQRSSAAVPNTGDLLTGNERLIAMVLFSHRDFVLRLHLRSGIRSSRQSDRGQRCDRGCRRRHRVGKGRRAGRRSGLGDRVRTQYEADQSGARARLAHAACLYHPDRSGRRHWPGTGLHDLLRSRQRPDYDRPRRAPTGVVRFARRS